MCTVSNVGDAYGRTFPERYPGVAQGSQTITYTMMGVSQEEFNKLKAEVAELKILLLAAKRFDEATGQADCETDEKVALIKAIAELVGVDMEDVFGD